MVLPKHHISLNARNKKQALFWLALVENSINPPILHTTYYFDIFFEDKNLSYDVYYSETNPTDLDLSNLTYLKKK